MARSRLRATRAHIEAATNRAQTSRCDLEQLVLGENNFNILCVCCNLCFLYPPGQWEARASMAVMATNANNHRRSNNKVLASSDYSGDFSINDIFSQIGAAVGISRFVIFTFPKKYIFTIITVLILKRKYG